MNRTANRLVRPICIALIIGTAFVIILWTGLWGLATDAERLQRVVHASGALGPVLFVVLFTALVPVGVPGLAFVLPASVMFSAPTAIALSLIGGYTSSSIGVIAARSFARQAIEKRLPLRFIAWDKRIARQGLLAVIALRIVTYLAAPADWLLGLSSIRMRTIVVGTVIGLIPPTVIYVVAGAGIFELLS